MLAQVRDLLAFSRGDIKRSAAQSSDEVPGDGL